jgi:hypothetical protein
MLPAHLTRAVMTIMAWTWKQIEQDWLADGRVATEPSAVVEAFERVETAFGREWIEQSRVHPLVVPKGSAPQTTVVRGSSPVLAVVQMGRLLTPLEGIPGVDTLMQKLRRGERAAMAEATAIYLLRQHPSDSVLELEPVVPVAGRSDRKGDFRVRRNGDPWTYVEVSATDQTATEREALRLLERLGEPAHFMSGSFALELFFRSLPDEDEVEAILRRVRDLDGRADSLSEELPEKLGTLVYDTTRDPTDVSPRVLNEPYRPGLGRAAVVHRDGEARSITVRLPYTDTRGRKKLGKESLQLPRNDPGLVMIDTAGAPGSRHSWEPAIRGDLHNHTRVSAVCLFQWASMPRDDLAEFLSVTGRLIVNPSARRTLPPWIVKRLSALAEP